MDNSNDDEDSSDEKPTIELTPDQELDEAEPPDERDPQEVGDRLKELRQEHYDDEILESVKNYGKPSDSEPEKEIDYEAVDDALLKAIKRSSWWADEYLRGERDDLSEAPGIWRRDSQFPDHVREIIKDVIRNNDWNWDQFESLTYYEAQRLPVVLGERMTRLRGWSIASLSDDLQDAFGLEEDTAVGIAAETSHNVLNTAREEAYEHIERSEEIVFDWVGPQNHRTSQICEEIKAEIEDRGGAVTLPTLKQILRQKAQKYEDSGTPEKVEQWSPHRGCRHTLEEKG